MVPSGSRRFESCAVFDTIDHNAPQTFDLMRSAAVSVVALRLTFPASTDPFGRVTIYNIALEGTDCSITG